MSSYLAKRDSARLTTLSRVAQVSIAIYILVWIVVAAISGWMLSIVMTEPYGQAWYIAFGVRSVAMGIGILFFVASVPPILAWFHKSLANLHDAGLSGLSVRPGWSVGSFFVPVANLFVPFLAMRELWNRSHGEDEWQAKASVSEITIWWTCYLAGTLLVSFVTCISLFNIFTNAGIVTPVGVNPALELTGVSLWCISALFLFRIIGKITKAQQSLADERLTFA
ncbi:hypothetical protein GCM10011494_18570 [Novosphingobium endophyticum]|uniref:DUF4328 domain-containing protein n=1 Tax=Novosphingobium endophyticum TaxID=1955250 RepID=A0A916X4E6_9SPHN|nr:DUF4328 domain-containing protein [Novosphingobium endophyticum]GGC00289.1 hypothetical protein GCM10011494_18570 [Novosphingobium endophyticum]